MAESARTFWKGHLRLALVSIPVRLIAAEKAESEIRFHQVDRKSKQRIRYLKVASGKGEVKKEDIVLGYEVEPGNYVFMEDEELDTLKLSSRHTIELSQFVDADEIEPLYFNRPYYVLPDGEVAEEGYRVLRDALWSKRKVGIGQLTLRGRENLVALLPAGDGQGLVLDTLRYESELKDAEEIFSSIGRDKPREDMVQMAEDLIERRSEPFDAAKFHNHYAEALRDLVKTKLGRGETVPVEEQAQTGAKVLDFMEALKRSVAASGGEAPPEPPKKGRAPAKKAAPAKSSKTSKAPTRRRA
ncbi:Ku protein [Methylocystis parvus]|uniref:Non-homologous end joining protein Ku n=1 Tax=Methylocystis parvus TaxID=134 RepID=A0A6B8MA23_9HYPH|nr:Ku protein [Methylocystis parvus]QGM98449.1 Ku protein [Methylocystis parvus]WBK01214.1 Ku protein [Methylocystis parvus OBBP]